MPKTNPLVQSCSEHSDIGKNPTKVNFLGHWLRTPDNPGKIARQYGMEYLRHRKHILAQDLNSGESGYELLPMGFEK